MVIRVDKNYFRPSEVNELMGDSSKAFNKLGWKPKISLEDMIEEMVKNDKREAYDESIIKKYSSKSNS